MAENRALLSQNEIDALVNFLTTKETVGNEVLDQSSIDRLVTALSEGRLMQKQEQSDGLGRFSGESALYVEQDIATQTSQCELCYEKDDNGMAHVVCVNRVTGVRYEITPETLNRRTLVQNPEENWGRAVMPVLFDLVAMQLRVRYTTATFSEVCEDFAKVMFGEEKKELPNVYLPTASRVLENFRE